jgi:hypothetical protein
MTVHELAAFPILVSSAVITIITIGEDVIPSAMPIASSSALCERGGGSHANDCR